MNNYPKCALTFIELINSEKRLTNLFINKLLKVHAFDVTLRDGLQSLPLTEQHNCTIDTKKSIYNKIINKYNPKNIEIGSYVNNKILPVFKDTTELYYYVENTNKNKNHYVLVPYINIICIMYK